MKKLSFLIASMFFSVGMQANQTHASNMSAIDSAISSVRTALMKLEQIRDNHEVIAKHSVTAKKMTDSTAFQSLNNQARDSVSRYCKDATSHLNRSNAQISAIDKHASAIASATDKALNDSSTGVQTVLDDNAAATATLKDHIKDTMSAADIASSQG